MCEWLPTLKLWWVVIHCTLLHNTPVTIHSWVQSPNNIRTNKEDLSLHICVIYIYVCKCMCGLMNVCFSWLLHCHQWLLFRHCWICHKNTHRINCAIYFQLLFFIFYTLKQTWGRSKEKKHNRVVLSGKLWHKPDVSHTAWAYKMSPSQFQATQDFSFTFTVNLINWGLSLSPPLNAMSIKKSNDTYSRPRNVVILWIYCPWWYLHTRHCMQGQEPLIVIVINYP